MLKLVQIILPEFLHQISIAEFVFLLGLCFQQSAKLEKDFRPDFSSSMSTDALFTHRLATSELSQKILDMATTGVYRESIFEALQPLATKKQIREAITHAKRFGLRSVASLRDSELGTYYQLDAAKYQALQHALHSAVHLGKDGELVQRLSETNQMLERIVTVAQSLAGLLSLLSVLCWVSGWHSFSLGLGSAALSAIVLWQLQRQIAQRIQR